MNKLEESLSKIAETIYGMDEASLSSLWEKYKIKAHNFSPSQEWEKSFIIFSIINLIRAKNSVFNEQTLKLNSAKKPAFSRPETRKSNLKLVK
ncbi:MAG: hypothetical protein JW914_08765 [Syntrophaceae bacterium]|nr:hypothetical protein [Syntrophaceae bacterium]